MGRGPRLRTIVISCPVHQSFVTLVWLLNFIKTNVEFYQDKSFQNANMNVFVL